MALRGFRNDDTRFPGRSSRGEITRSQIAGVLKKGGPVRSAYDSLPRVTAMSEFQGRPGVQVAGEVAAAVVRSTLPESSAH